MTQQAVPESIESMYALCDRIIDRQIVLISRGQCRKDERNDIKQDVYVRAIKKNFLARTAELFAERGGGCFEQSLFRLTQSVTVNHFEHKKCRPLARAVSMPEGRQLDALLLGVDAIVRADAARQAEACEYLDAFGEWLQTRRGRYARARLTPEGQPIDVAEVYRLWRLYGENRHVTHQIAKHLQLTDKWVRDLKRRLRGLHETFCKVL